MIGQSNKIWIYRNIDYSFPIVTSQLINIINKILCYIDLITLPPSLLIKVLRIKYQDFNKLIANSNPAYAVILIT